jgi:nucleoside-diphosphate-sugar epimerase
VGGGPIAVDPITSVGVSSWDGRAALVTGAGGFMGSHLVDVLVASGARVRALCRYTSGAGRGALELLDPARLREVEVRFGDLRDPETTDRAADGIEVAFHLGALISVPYSYINPREYVETNVAGTLNVAQAALRHGIERLVHVSSSEVYGEVTQWPIDERQPPAPRSPYAASKAAADLLLQSFRASFGLPVAVARPFNTYGPGQSARAIVPAIVAQALAGDTVRLGSLAPRRDLTFVGDTVAGLMAIAATDAAIGQTLQLGTGLDVSVGELVDLVGEVLGRRLVAERDPDRVRPAGSEVSRLVCDARRATELTGWRPRVALRDGLAETVNWIGVHRDRYRADEYAR